ncbi:MAG: hypothetical protein U0X58_03990 [Flavobacteriaceae bacterium]
MTSLVTGCSDTAQALITPSLPPSDILVYASILLEDNQMVRVDVNSTGGLFISIGQGW